MESKRGQEMLSFLPWYYQDSKIMQSILNAQGIEIDSARYTIADILNQFYVDTATWGLNLWEKDLNIKNVANNYDERRRKIKLYLMKPASVTPEFMELLANNYLDDGSAKIIEHNSEYWFELEFNLDALKSLSDLREAINLYKPAHLGFVIAFKILTEIKTSHKANIIHFIDGEHNFWNLGNASLICWNGEYKFNGFFNWNGIKPDVLYRTRQTHLVDIYAIINIVQNNFGVKKCWNGAFYWDNYFCWDGLPFDIVRHKINYKNLFIGKYHKIIANKSNFICNIDLKQKLNINYVASNLGKINTKQSRMKGKKNLFDGFFVFNGTHKFSGEYINNNMLENICTIETLDKDGAVTEGSMITV